jgi:hypothetical protein
MQKCYLNKPRDGKRQKLKNANFGTFHVFMSIQENVCLSGLRTKLPDIKLQYVKYQNVPFISTNYITNIAFCCAQWHVLLSEIIVQPKPLIKYNKSTLCK